jgi:hypothetical protein
VTSGTSAAAGAGVGSVTDPVDVVNRFNDAFNRHDLDAVMALAGADCVFESTAPPDGDRHEGAAAVRAAWGALFEASPGASFVTEELFAAHDRVVVRWRYDWAGGSGGHVRGVDVFRVVGGLVVEKLAYVKG